MLNVGELAEAYKEQQLTPHPTTECILPVFPPYICGAIRRVRNKAAITMTLQYDLERLVTWPMSLDVLANKFQYIAMSLFGGHVETEDGLQYMVLGMVRYVVRDQILLYKE